MGGGAANARALDSGPPSSSTYGGTDDLSVVVEALTATTQSLKEDLARERETNEAFRTSTLKHQRAKRESRDDRSSPDAPDARRSLAFPERPSLGDRARRLFASTPFILGVLALMFVGLIFSVSRGDAFHAASRDGADDADLALFETELDELRRSTEISRDDWKTRVSTQMWSANQRGARRRSPRANPRTRRSRKRRRRNRRRGVASTTDAAPPRNDADAETPAANATRDMAMRAEATSADELPVASTGLRETGERDAADAASEVEAEPKAEPKAEGRRRRGRRRRVEAEVEPEAEATPTPKSKTTPTPKSKTTTTSKSKATPTSKSKTTPTPKSKATPTSKSSKTTSKKDPASSSGASRSAREALERAETISSSLARHESWARKMSMRLDEYDDKLTRLNDALERKRDSDSHSDLIVSPEVKLGVEKVRRWEERAATRLAESRGRSEEAMRQAETLRRSAASLPEDDDSDAEFRGRSRGGFAIAASHSARR